MALLPAPRHRLAAAALAVLAGGMDPLAAQTQLPVQAATPAINATVTTPATGQMRITQDANQPRAYVEWRDFSIGAQATVTVSQGSANAVLLNRVVATGGTVPPSRIDGALLADTVNGAAGHVYLLNPAGIVFGAGAQVQLGSLVAAALDTRTSGTDFVAGTALELLPGGGTLTVEPGARLDLRSPAISSGGDLPGRAVLIGGNGLVMDGQLQTAGGAAWLGLAQGGVLPASGVPVGSSGFVTLQTTPAALGTLALGGSVLLQAAAGSTLPEGTLQLSAPEILIGRRTGVVAPPVDLVNAQIDAVGSGGPGRLVIRGEAEGGTAVRVRNSTLHGADVEIAGVSVVGTTPADGPSHGVQLDQVSIAIGDGRLQIAGRGEDASGASSVYGVGLSGLSVTTAAGGGQSVRIAGESVGSTGAGVVAINDGLNTIGSEDPATGPSAASVQLGASAGPRGLAWQLFGPPTVETTGTVNLLPLGVGRDGVVVARADVPIGVGGESGSVASGFHVPVDWLRDPRLTQASGFTTPALVIGSAGHAGAISAAGDVMSAANVPALTLQNGAADAAGIVIGAGAVASDPARELTLISGGPVTQEGPLAVTHLLLGGRAERSDVRLDRADNRIERLSFVDLRSLQLQTTGTLAVAAGTLLGDSGVDGTTASSNRAAPLAASRQAVLGSTASQQVLLQSAADLVLEQGVRTTAAGSRIDLVAAGLFQNPGDATLATGTGGTWRVWSSTSEGSSRGSLPAGATLATRYGCAFGDVGQCAVSQASLPDGGSGFLYRFQPDLVVVPDPVAFPRGTLLPGLGFRVQGLLNGDAAGAAVAGAPATTANLLSAPGQYAVVDGTLTSPTGYRLVLDASALTAVTVLPPDPLRSAYSDGLAQLLDGSASETHGRNLPSAGSCAAAGAGGVGELPVGSAADLLGLEWRRVRSRPQFSSCLDIDRAAGRCAGF